MLLQHCYCTVPLLTVNMISGKEHQTFQKSPCQKGLRYFNRRDVSLLLLLKLCLLQLMEIVELCGIFMCWVVSVQSNRVRVRLMPLPQSVSFVYTIFPNDFREAVFVCLTSIGTALSQSDPLPLKIILLGVRLQDSLATQDSPGGRHFPPHSTPSESP